MKIIYLSHNILTCLHHVAGSSSSPPLSLFLIILSELCAHVDSLAWVASARARASKRREAYQAWNEEAKMKENFSVCSNSNQSLCISWHFAGFSMLINAYKHVLTAPISVRRVHVYRRIGIPVIQRCSSEFGPMSLCHFAFSISLPLSSFDDQPINGRRKKKSIEIKKKKCHKM